MNKYYVVPEERLKQLIIQANCLEALQSGGVESWTFYGDALDEAYTQWAENIGIIIADKKTFWELENLIAENDLKEYQEVADWRLP